MCKYMSLFIKVWLIDGPEIVSFKLIMMPAPFSTKTQHNWFTIDIKKHSRCIEIQHLQLDFPIFNFLK